ELRFCVRPHSDIGVQFRPIFAWLVICKLLKSILLICLRLSKKRFLINIPILSEKIDNIKDVNFFKSTDLCISRTIKI
ncbi:hypothetical protein N5U33_04930, partial [Aliarcobacter butzleri]|nr:hypothetical protein [Aliarcobacter butzleri]